MVFTLQRKGVEWMRMSVLCASLIQATVAVADTAFQPDFPAPEPPSRLKELHELTDRVDYDQEQQGVQQMRLQTLKQSAFSWGVQEGLYWRYQRINALLEAQSLALHTVFDFRKFLVDGKLLLPTVVEAERIYEQTSDDTARTVNVSFTLDKPARLMPQPPTWRDYLMRAIDEPVQPHAVVFPRNSNEHQAWIEQLDSGWQEGIKQADDVFELDLRRLQKDIEGMYRFRKLLAMGVVTLPVVSSSAYPVLTFNNGNTINLNDVVYSITTQSGFTDTDTWEPFFRQRPGRE